MREALERLLATCTSNLISQIGTGITTASPFLFVLLLLMHLGLHDLPLDSGSGRGGSRILRTLLD